jgi:hypothetical protein
MIGNGPDIFINPKPLLCGLLHLSTGHVPRNDHGRIICLHLKPTCPTNDFLPYAWENHASVYVQRCDVNLISEMPFFNLCWEEEGDTEISTHK